MAVQQKRIAHLDPAVDPDHSVDIVTEIISSQSEAEKWALPVDYVKTEDDPDPDRGTKQVPLNRVALLTESGLVPASMLPSYISTVKRGKMEVSGTKWTFTEEDTGNKYVCPDDPDQGEETPSVDCIYADTGNTSSSSSSDDYYQYRFVPTGITGEDDTGHFVPIPSDLVVQDGDGTLVVDNRVAYTRQIDVNIGSPVSTTANANPLLISSGQLCHAAFHTAGTALYPSSQPSGFPNLDFGSQFYIPRVSVNGTGHITEGGADLITIPDTAATSTTTGLVKIGTSATSIGQTASAGGTPYQDGYVRVSAADHVHNAANLTLQNVNGENNVTQLVYNGSSPVTYDFNNILKAVLPASAPSNGFILVVESVSGGQGLGAYQAVWKSPDEVINPAYVFADIGSGAISTSGASTMTLGNATKYNVLGVSSNAVTGISSNKTYMVSYSISLQNLTAGPNLVEFSVGVKIGSGTAVVNKYIVDESVHGTSSSLFSQWVNGTIFVTAGQAAGNLTLECNITAGVSWNYAGGTIQVAEVK